MSRASARQAFSCRCGSAATVPPRRDKLPGICPTRVRVSPSAPFRSRSSNYQSATLRTSRLQVRILPGVPIYGHVVKPEQQRIQTQNLAALGVQFPSCPPAFARSAAIARLPRRSTQCIGGRNRPHSRATARQATSRRLASAGTADPGDLKSPSLPGASPGSPTGVWFTGNSRPVRLKPEQPWECKSPHADQLGMSTGQANRACLLNSALPETGVWCKSTAFRHARVVQREPSAL